MNREEAIKRIIELISSDEASDYDEGFELARNSNITLTEVWDEIKKEVEAALYLYDQKNIDVWKTNVRRAYYLFMALKIMCITDDDIFSIAYSELSSQVNISLLYQRIEIARYINTELDI